MKKFAYIIILFAYATGTIGGIGYVCYAGAWVIAVTVAVLGAMAFPTAKKFYHKITE